MGADLMRTEVAPQATDWAAFEPTSFSFTILRALNLKGPMYAGTADPGRVAQRRAKNRVARRSRRINRR
ncbi:hypothetical protein [Pseudonocardia sp. NPDC049154]|uniref:hypothetical protein n=1 Tax=Pseudonocardia sp. NPDC049154 TaxID=3155501 RepID=UPI0034046A0D